MKIAFFAAMPPVPPTSGYQLRCLHLARALLREGHQLHFFFFDPVTNQARRSRRLSAVRDLVAAGLGVGIEHVSIVDNRKSTAVAAALALPSWKPFHVVQNKRRAMDAAIRAQQPSQFDAIYMNLIYFMEYRRLFREDAVTIVDQHNLDRDVWRGLSRSGRTLPRRLYAAVNLLKTMAYERYAYDRTDLCVSCASRDLEGSSRISSRPRYLLAPNGVDYSAMQAVQQSIRSAAFPCVLFVGGPSDKNLAAVERLHSAILPRIRDRIPNVRLRIAGQVCTTLPQTIAADPSVEVLGPVPDITMAYAGAWVLAAPFVYGGGTKLKILEALAAGIPVIGSTNAVQGIDLPPRLMEFVSDDDATLASLVIEVLDSAPVAAELADKGRQVAWSYRWEAALEPVLRELRVRPTAHLH